MPQFEYKAVSRTGEMKSGRMAGTSQQEVIASLQKMGLIPISAALPGVQQGSASPIARRLASRTLRAADIAVFTKQLSTLVGAGLPLDRALAIVRQTTSHIGLANLIAEIQAAVRSGDALSKALRAHPRQFSDFYINFIRSAEVSGSFAESLSDLAGYLEKAQALKARLLSAMIYPIILVIVTVGALIIIMGFVMPEFSQLFEDMDAPLPTPTAVVLAVSDFVRDYAVVGLGIVAVVMVYVAVKARDQAWRMRWDQRFLELPLAGDLIKKIEMARLSRSLGTLLKGGVPLLKSMTIARDGISNRVLGHRLEQVTSSLQEGSSLAGPLLDTGVFPEFAIQMIQIGEETGQLDAMLVRVADIYDDEVATSAQRVLAILGPAMVITLGVLIGGIIMSILVAVMGINELPG